MARSGRRALRSFMRVVVSRMLRPDRLEPYNRDMGRLNYDASAAFDIDDRLLAHLRIVAMNKLRRGESFMLQ